MPSSMYKLRRRRAASNSRCCAPTTVTSSLPRSLPPTAWMRGSSATTPHRTRRSRTAWSSRFCATSRARWTTTCGMSGVLMHHTSSVTATATSLATSTRARAQVAFCSSSATDLSAGSPSSRGWWHFQAAKLSTLLPPPSQLKHSGWLAYWVSYSRAQGGEQVCLAKNPVFYERSKHIRIKYHFIRSCLEEGSVKASHISTEDQLADILTKSLGRVKFHELRAQIGLVHNTT
jgi:hypothetical protein